MTAKGLLKKVRSLYRKTAIMTLDAAERGALALANRERSVKQSLVRYEELEIEREYNEDAEREVPADEI